MNSFVKGCFVIVGAVTVSSILYYALFGTTPTNGAVYKAISSAEKPISKYYENYGTNFSENWDGVGTDLFQESGVSADFQQEY